MVTMGAVYPIFYVQYHSEGELTNKINALASTYNIVFDPADKKYPQANDYDDFKMMVVECKNALNEEQISNIVKTFKYFGQDMLYSSDIGYCYFVGANGEELTKSIFNNYTKMNAELQRNIESTPQQPKDVCGKEDMFGNFIVKDYMPQDIDNQEITMLLKKESKENANIYGVFRCLVYDDNTIDNLKKILSKKEYGVKFSDGDSIFASSDIADGAMYKTIKIATPLTKETVSNIISKIRDYGNSAYIPEIQSYVTLLDDRGINITRNLLNMNLKINYDDMVNQIDKIQKK